VEVLGPEDRVSATDYSVVRALPAEHLLLDVRERELFDVGSIRGAVNVPYSEIRAGEKGDGEGGEGGQPGWMPAGWRDDVPIYVVCRVGNDSQVVAKMLRERGRHVRRQRFIGDIRGGMQAWKREIDPTFPFL